MFVLQHHTEATFHLGLMYLHGTGVRQDKLLALRHLSLAAKVGHPLAMYNMAMLHLGPNPALPPSCPTALDLLKRVSPVALQSPSSFHPPLLNVECWGCLG